jgi:COP9 signalosome complex subunit 4
MYYTAEYNCCWVELHPRRIHFNLWWRVTFAGMEAKLSHLATLPSKDQANGYLSVLSNIISRADQSSMGSDIHLLVDFVTQDHVNIVTGRPVLAELVKALDEKRVRDRERRKAIVEDCLRVVQPRLTRFEEQVTSDLSMSRRNRLTENKATFLRYQLADLLEEEEDFSESARVLMTVQLDAGHRCVYKSVELVQRVLRSFRTDEEKLKTYIRIVRLLLEEEDSVQAETYYNRAALLIHSTQDKELQLAFKLCQARIHDYARKFLEAASRYHELSWVGDLDEDERSQALCVLHVH